MSSFQGFPSRSARQTPIPNLFFTAVLPLIDDLVELKVTLHLFHRLSWKKGYLRYVTLKELAGDLDLMSGLAQEGKDPAEELRKGLRQALARGTFLHLSLPRHEAEEHLYCLNTEVERRALERVRRGEVDLGALPKLEAPPEAPERRDIFTLYEQNIGVLTPLIAEELRELEQQYPAQWIVEAFREASLLNAKSLRYVQRILERWKAEGRPHGKPVGDTETVRTRGEAPRRGGYLVKRRSS